jgi:hypothetical protein
MSKKIVWIVVGVIFLVGAFYGGMFYGKSQTVTTPGAYAAGARTRGVGATGGFGGATIGKIISKDATSITVQLMTGGQAGTASGSKIIFLDNTTPITKQVTGTMSDLSIGTNVSVIGTANTDGSMSAQSVQIRPNVPNNGIK